MTRSSLKGKEIDDALLQETKIETCEDASSFVRAFRNEFWCFHTLTVVCAGDTGILIRKHDSITTVDCELAEDGRFGIVDALVGRQLARFICVYAPNEAATRAEVFNSLRPFILVAGTVGFGGDFNYVMSANDRAGRGDSADTSVGTLGTLLRDSDLADVRLGGSWATARYTRWRGASQARLDRIYVSGVTLAQVKGCAITPVCFADHGLVQCTVKLGIKRMEAFGKRRWIMNAKILFNDEFIETVKQEIENLTACPLNVVTWELFKEKIEAVTTTIGQREAAQKKTKFTG